MNRASLRARPLYSQIKGTGEPRSAGLRAVAVTTLSAALLLSLRLGVTAGAAESPSKGAVPFAAGDFLDPSALAGSRADPIRVAGLSGDPIGPAADGAIVRVQQTGRPLPPRIRPVLISNDPAGDDNIFCYVNPETYSNGYTDSPAALVDKCIVEITDTLVIEFGGAKPGHVNVVRGPGGYFRQVRSSDYYEQYFPPGSALGEYDFTGASQGRSVSGGFTLKAASKRIVQLRFKDREEHDIDYLALAGFRPGETVGINLYKQISFRPDVGTGERRWQFSRYLGSVQADDRGEAKVQIPPTLLDAKGYNLLVSEPMQENDLNSARVSFEAQQ